MPKNTKSINDNLFRMLKSHGYEPIPLDSAGKKIPVPEEADVFQFTIRLDHGGDGDSTGRIPGRKNRTPSEETTVTVSIDDNHDLKVYYSSEASQDDNWYKLLKTLKNYAVRNQLGFDPTDEDQLTYDMAKREKVKRESVREGKFTINRKTGARLHPRTGEELPPKEKSLTMKQMFSGGDDREPEFGVDLDDVWREFTIAASNVAPDVEPYEDERFRRWLKQRGITGHKIGDVLDAAAKKHDYDSWSDYSDSIRQYATDKQGMTEKINEGYYAAGRRQSYNDAIPQVKILVQHNRSLEEGDQRFRYVERIFVENMDGERIRVPTTNTAIARTFARLIAEGDKPYGDRWTQLQRLAEDYTNIRGFVRATSGRQLNEGTNRLLEACQQQYAKLRESLHKLTTHRGYHQYFENWSPTLLEGEDSADTSALENMLGESLLADTRVSGGLSTLQRINATISENAAITEVDELEEWANNIIDETLDEPVDDENDDPVGDPDEGTSPEEWRAQGLMDEQDMAEGFSDVVKGIKRTIKGKEHPDVVASKHAGRAIGHYNQGDIAAGDKETKRYVKTRDMHLKTEGVGKDLAKIGGITGAAIGLGILGHHQDQKAEKIEVGGQQARLIQNPGRGAIPDTAMILKGKDGRTYKVWTSSGKGSKVLLATPVENVREQGVVEGVSAQDKNISVGDYVQTAAGVEGVVKHISSDGKKLTIWNRKRQADHRVDITKAEKIPGIARRKMAEQGVAEDPVTGALIGGALGLAAGAKGAHHAAKKGKERWDDPNSPPTSVGREAGKYVKDFVQGIVDPRTYKKKSADKKDVKESGKPRNPPKADQVGATEKAKKISPVLGSKPKKHPFNGKLVGGD